jgi:dihydrofolate reductase
VGQLIVSTQMTLDGVMNPIEWFNRKGEHAWDTAAGRASFDQLRAADALLLGRKTYEGLADVWPSITDEVGFAKRINGMPKFVASRSPRGKLAWNARQLEGVLADDVAALKRRQNGNLISYGCGEMAHELLTCGLVDELRFWINPIVFGDGARPFLDRYPVSLQLLSTTSFETGIVLLSYGPVACA